tara:strand:- start:431 stop:649 length:219 start_codon:yes stop_codon:yes gene_type:complete
MKVRVKLDKPIVWRASTNPIIEKEFIYEHDPNDDEDISHRLVGITSNLINAMMYQGVKKFSLEVVDEIQKGK